MINCCKIKSDQRATGGGGGFTCKRGAVTEMSHAADSQPSLRFAPEPCGINTLVNPFVNFCLFTEGDTSV